MKKNKVPKIAEPQKRDEIQDTADAASPNAILAEKETLSALVNSIQDEIWFADTENHIRLANPAALHEFSLEAGKSVSVEDLVETVEPYRPDGTPRPVAEAPLIRALKGEVIRNEESIKSSRSLTAELSPTILHDAGLNAGLQWLGRRMADTQGLFVDLTTEQIGSLPDDLTILLFESVRELLFNVAKHAGTHSACVRLCRIDESLQVTVSDQGVGFDPNELPPAGEAGRGFGLFSIRERLELFGGKMGMDSAPGRGSRFVISLPITSVGSRSAEVAELPKEIVPKLIPTHVPGRKIRVLLADDHAVVRQGIANLLGDEPDIEVVGAAADGQETVNLTAKLLPDVILMDMNMPKLNGVEATRIIHNDYSEIYIIGLSMFEENEKAQAMRDAGVANYLTKSGPAEALINAVRMGGRRSGKSFSAKALS